MSILTSSLHMTIFQKSSLKQKKTSLDSQHHLMNIVLQYLKRPSRNSSQRSWISRKLNLSNQSQNRKKTNWFNQNHGTIQATWKRRWRKRFLGFSAPMKTQSWCLIYSQVQKETTICPSVPNLLGRTSISIKRSLLVINTCKLPEKVFFSRILQNHPETTSLPN